MDSLCNPCNVCLYVWRFAHIFDTFDKFCRIYVAHKFVLHHSMAAREMGDIKEMALRQKFELSIFQQRPQGVCIYKQILNEYFEEKRNFLFAKPALHSGLAIYWYFPHRLKFNFRSPEIVKVVWYDWLHQLNMNRSENVFFFLAANYFV